jgi:hypothetical protein
VRENEARKTRAETRRDAQAVARIVAGDRQSVDDLVLAVAIGLWAVVGKPKPIFPTYSRY